MNLVQDIPPKEYIESHSIAVKWKAYWQLLKPRLSLLVSFSAVFGYMFASNNNISWRVFIGLFVGGFCVSGAAVIINQIWERSLDKLMNRTLNRPIPSGKVSIAEAMRVMLFVFVVGIFVLSVSTNLQTVALSMISTLLYGFFYTPLKRKGPIAVWVGAIPGALPPLLGYLAAKGVIDEGAWIIFVIQFVWQFPHFWAIAWVADEDYRKAGFKLLPSQYGTDRLSAFSILFFNLLLIPVSLLPCYFGMTGNFSASIALCLSIAYCIPAVFLLLNPNRKTALWSMFSSFLYLPLIQISYLIDLIK
jgi:heme o synthase